MINILKIFYNIGLIIFIIFLLLIGYFLVGTFFYTSGIIVNITPPFTESLYNNICSISVFISLLSVCFVLSYITRVIINKLK